MAFFLWVIRKAANLTALLLLFGVATDSLDLIHALYSRTPNPILINTYPYLQMFRGWISSMSGLLFTITFVQKCLFFSISFSTKYIFHRAPLTNPHDFPSKADSRYASSSQTEYYFHAYDSS